MSRYEMRLATAQINIRDQIRGILTAFADLNNALIYRQPLQDDEDDALVGCSHRLRDVEYYIRLAIEELEG